jgi:DNA-binding transcriptional LysR family regulator
MNLSNVNLNLLIALDALLKEQHVTRAGERLHITQSVMSNLLKQLRAVFKDELFVRGQASRMIPTPRALALAQPVKTILAQVADIFTPLEQFNAKTAKHTFTLGLSDYAEFVLLPPLIQLITKQAPQIEIVIKHLNYLSDEIPFEDSIIDLAIGIYPTIPENLVAEKLFTEESVCLGWHKNPLLKKPLNAATFAKAKQIVILYHEERAQLFSEQYLKKQGLKRHVVATVPHTMAAIHSLSGTDLICMVLKKVAQQASKQLPLIMQPAPFAYPAINIHMVWHTKERNNPAHQWLRQQIKDLVKKI